MAMKMKMAAKKSSGKVRNDFGRTSAQHDRRLKCAAQQCMEGYSTKFVVVLYAYLQFIA